MDRVLLIKYGEISLKGKNRHRFEQRLMSNIKNSLGRDIRAVRKTYGRLIVELDTINKEVIDKLRRVFGIISVCPAVRTGLDLDEIKEAALTLLAESTGDTFKVSARRSNKKYPLTSPELNQELGGYLLEHVKGWKVDVHNPMVYLYVEVREGFSFLYTQGYPGFGGLPVGTTGKGILLLSGGIDSPVAGWLGMKRGLQVIGLHFHSYPFTSERATEKVLDLARILAKGQGEVKLYLNHFTEIQKAIRQNCPSDLGITIMRRMMFRIAHRLALKEDALALLTGENLGQVASQTLESMAVINKVTDLPVLRPLITMDKIEIIELAKQIETYETSILPYEDCCTLFLPEHPATRPRLEKVIRAEDALAIDELIEQSFAKTEVVIEKPI